LKETISWGKVKGEADDVMVIGDIMMVFPLMVSSVMERLGVDFKRDPVLNRLKKDHS
jgi:deoxyhypusine synthase